MPNKFDDFVGLLNESIRFFMIENKRTENMIIYKPDVRKILENFVKTFPKAKKFELEIERHIRTSCPKIIEKETTLRGRLSEGRDHQDWFTEEKKVWKNKFYMKSHFAFYKHNFEKKLGPKRFEQLDLSSDKILEEIEDPNREAPWDTRGMVVGDVQSGKTANYTALITKALDLGFKLMIVFGGIYNNLRDQTQKRLAENVIKTSTEIPKVNFLTGEMKVRNGKIIDTGDFSQTMSKRKIFPGMDPAILVIKKNVSMLKNVIEWLSEQDGVATDDTTNLVWQSSGDGTRLPKNKLIVNTPLLLIDDECDSASLDISKREGGNRALVEYEDEDAKERALANPSQTNLLIRRILESFNKKAYIGYTATPLANVFIDFLSATPTEGKDLFPKDFVKLLYRWEDYCSPKKIFGESVANWDEDSEEVTLSEEINEEDYKNVKWIYDYRNDHKDLEKKEQLCLENKGFVDEESDRDLIYFNEGKSRKEETPEGWMPLYHQKDHKCHYENQDDIPDSLKEAIKTFFINSAIRFYRDGKIDHNSMLIHVSRFVNVQARVKTQVENYIKEIQKKLGNSTRELEIKKIEKEFRDLWQNQIKKRIDNSLNPDEENIEFEKIWKIAKKIILDEEKLDVVQINSKSADMLNYGEKKDGWNVIVIGGAAISRGLTLEGLNTSYFLRIAKIPVADTLTQMGRWFGYRKNYEDIFKIYLPKKLHVLFRQFTYAMEFARDRFSLMSSEKKSPIEFAIEIPSFPGWRLVSAIKMRDTIERKEPLIDSVYGRNHQTIVFHDGLKQFENNRIVIDYINNLGPKFETSEDINKRIKGKIGQPNIKGKVKQSDEIEEIKSKIEMNITPFSYTYLWRNVGHKKIISFLKDYHYPTKSLNDTHPVIIASNIELLAKQRNLDFNVILFGVNRGQNFKYHKLKNKILMSIIERSENIRRKPKIGEFSLGTLSDPQVELADMEPEQFEKGVNSWLNYFKNTGKFAMKGSNIPARFKTYIRKERERGLLVIYPFTKRGKKLINNFDFNKELHFGWDIIIPPTRKAGNIELVHNVVNNRVAIEHMLDAVRSVNEIKNSEVN